MSTVFYDHRTGVARLAGDRDLALLKSSIVKILRETGKYSCRWLVQCSLRISLQNPTGLQRTVTGNFIYITPDKVII